MLMVGLKLGLVGRLLGFGEYILDFRGFKNTIKRNFFYIDDQRFKIRILEGIDEVN